MFRGRFDHIVDDKGRISLPVKFREILRKYDDNLVITTFDDCLYAYPNQEWEKVEEMIHNLPPGKRAVRDFQRLFISSASECTIDKQGRVLIPPSLRTQAQIVKEVVIAGGIKHFEIWNKERFEQTISQALSREPGEDIHEILNNIRL